MNSLLLITLVAPLLSLKANSHDIAERINSMQSTWKAQPNHVTERGIENLKKMLGARLEKIQFLPVKPERRLINLNIPDSFDARSKWPGCTTISSVKDQSDCGSCWAVAAASSMSDRLCIASGGKINVNISSEQVLSCCSYCGDGCNGGYPDEAWKYASRAGIVSGGDYGSDEGCQPYAISPCSSNPTKGLPRCVDDVDTPMCYRECTNIFYRRSFYNDLHKFQSPYRISSSVASIQAEIMENGPVEAAFTVYADFNYYNRGVYQYTFGRAVGGHAIRIIGWGTENNVDYWLCANSWTPSWGEGGFFKIARGTNECGIEDSVIAGLPDL
uniref:Cathepsin B7 n=1 Tax=Mahanarva fimbriolata TaxID=672148 RepID=A0A7U3RXB6_9HEMI|nr:cathepsin B7 [Mahanarva fimbriolata]